MHRGRNLSQISNHPIQFNRPYRWYAATSQADEEWAEKMSFRTFPGKEAGEVHSSFVAAHLTSSLHLPIRPLDSRAGIQSQVEKDPDQRNRRYNLNIWRVCFYG